MKEVIIIRLSAIGDVALCLPVVQRLLALDAQIQITMVTKPNTAFIFENLARVKIIEAQTETAHKGVFGIIKLAKLIKTQTKNIYAVVDLHQVLRSKFLFFLLRSAATKSASISKNRSAKKHILSTAKNAKASSFSLPHITEIYAKAFSKIGLKVDTRFAIPVINNSAENREIATSYFLKNGAAYNVAFAPFAKHAGKILPWPIVLEILQSLDDKGIHIFMYGGNGVEAQQMQEAAAKFTCVKLVESLSFAQQIALLNFMQCAITMDSANMHFAALQGVPLVSIWGATSTQTGFGPLDKNATIIEIAKTELPCRPCSVYGNKICHLKAAPYACLQNLQSQTIVQAVYKKLGL